MKSNWKTLQIRSFAEVKSGKRLPKGHQLVSFKTNFPYIRLVDIKDGKIQEENIQYLKKETHELISRYIVNTNDICLAIVGHTIGMVFQVDNRWNKANLTENAARILIFSEDIDNKFIYYYLVSTKGQEKIFARKVGSAQGKLPLYNIRSLEVECPPLKTQKNISHILSTLDNKIELNKKINQTLESIAQAIFKSWFVDFDPTHAKANAQSEDEYNAIAKELGISREILDLFPSAFEESELGLIPKGWSYELISKISNVGIGKTPPRNEKQWFVDKMGIKWVSIKDMGINDTFIISTFEQLSKEAIQKFNVKIVPAFSVLLSFKLTVGRVSVTPEDMCTNEAIAHFNLLNNEEIYTEYLYLYLKSFDYGSLGSTSSIASAVNSKIVKTIPVLIPQKNILNSLHALIAPLFKNILFISRQNDYLKKIRNLLLPKLLSGELDVSNINLEPEND